MFDSFVLPPSLPLMALFSQPCQQLIGWSKNTYGIHIIDRIHNSKLHECQRDLGIFRDPSDDRVMIVMTSDSNRSGYTTRLEQTMASSNEQRQSTLDGLKTFLLSIYDFHQSDAPAPEAYLNKGWPCMDADRMPIPNMRRIYRAISDICRIMRTSASMRISKFIRMAHPNLN